MRRQAQDEVAQAARRRLELLRRELDQAGLAPTRSPSTEPLPEGVDPSTGELVEAAPVLEEGRHLRRRAGTDSGRLTGWLGDRMPPGLQGRVRLGGPHLVLVAAIAAAGLAAAAFFALGSGSGGTAVPIAVGSSAATGPGPISTVPGSPVVTASATATTGPARVVVDVAGKVRSPGVVTLPTGSRVIDALRKVGGARHGVSLTGLNLARVLTDGEQILVGAPSVPGVASSAASAATAAPAPGRLVSLNTATLEQLDTLPGVGPVTAQKILDWRTQHGSFSSVDELLEVDGIGQKTLADLAPYVTL